MTSVLPSAIVVLHAFGPYPRGALLTDPTIISAILNGGHASMVVRTEVLQHPAAGATNGEEH